MTMSDSDNPLVKWIASMAVPEDERHYAALGRFVASYAGAEAAVYVVARHLSKLDDAKARVIFAGMRLVDVTDRVRRMMEFDNTPKEISDDILSCLDQLFIIGDRRNDLVHRMVDYASGLIRAHNWMTAKSMASLEVRSFTFADLDNMALDCFSILMRLFGVVVPADHKDAEMESLVHQPWRYKPGQPKNANRRHREKVSPAKRRLPPPASSQ